MYAIVLSSSLSSILSLSFPYAYDLFYILILIFNLSRRDEEGQAIVMFICEYEFATCTSYISPPIPCSPESGGISFHALFLSLSRLTLFIIAPF